MVDPAGLVYGYKGWAVGKHRQAAKTEVEKLKLKELSVGDLVKEAARIILMVRDESKDKNFKLEIGWVGENTDGKFEEVPDKVLEDAQSWARARIDEDSDTEGDEAMAT